MGTYYSTNKISQRAIRRVMWIAIVDIKQSQRRCPAVLTDEDWTPASFESSDEIRQLKKEHALGAFDWWAFDMDTGDSIAC